MDGECEGDGSDESIQLNLLSINDFVSYFGSYLNATFVN